jgi:hypothetical protein
MARTGALLGVAVLAGLGIYAAVPDDEPEYLGDMPSIVEQATEAPPLPTRLVPSPPAPPPPPVAGPDPAVQEAPPAIPPAPGDRVPAPITDSPPDFSAGTSGNGDGGPGAGLLDGLPLDGLVPCVDTATVFQPGLGTIDCVTGLLQVPDPDLDVHPCSLVPLPVVCAAPLPLPPSPLD